MQSSVTGYVIKVAMLMLFLFIDLIMNVILEIPSQRFDEEETLDTMTSDGNTSSTSISKSNILQCALQVTSQLASFTIMFSIFTITLPFQLGLLSSLLGRFKVWFFFSGLYFLLTICMSSVRLVSSWTHKFIV